MPKCPDTSTANNFVFDSLTCSYCICDITYFFTGTECALCNTVDAACDDCASANLCLSCVDNFTLVKGVCKCSLQYYLVDNNTCQICEIRCLVCSGLGVCTVCDTVKYFTLKTGYCDCIVGIF